MWSVYYHTYYLQALRRSLLEAPKRGLGPIPLAEALKIVVAAKDSRSRHRQLRVLERIGLAGFANQERLNLLREKARLADDPHWQETISGVEQGVKLLAGTLNVPWIELSVIPVFEFPKYFGKLIKSLVPACQFTDATCVACYRPSDPDLQRPITTVTATALVSKGPRDMAKVFDPRSWGTCFDGFITRRVQPYDSSKDEYPDFGPDMDPIGLPWTGTRPYIFEEIVEIVTAASTNSFTNVLEITGFEVKDEYSRLDFKLHDSRRLWFPSMAVDEANSVTVDGGFMEATAVHGLGGDWSKLKLEKTVQFEDITAQGADPFGLDLGELLNYFAPAGLCMWLEDVTKGSVCCAGRP